MLTSLHFVAIAILTYCNHFIVKERDPCNVNQATVHRATRSTSKLKLGDTAPWQSLGIGWSAQFMTFGGEGLDGNTQDRQEK